MNEQVGFWMGANDIEKEGFFVWLDGSEGKLTNKSTQNMCILIVLVLNYSKTKQKFAAKLMKFGDLK